MTHTVSIDSLVYSPDHDTVRAVISGEMGGRHVDLQLQFPLRAHGEVAHDDLRGAALMELQQILRSASNVTLAERAPSGSTDVAARNRAISRWDNEGGAGPVTSRDVVWV
jgi:hypothetical protein